MANVKYAFGMRGNEVYFTLRRKRNTSHAHKRVFHILPSGKIFHEKTPRPPASAGAFLRLARGVISCYSGEKSGKIPKRRRERMKEGTKQVKFCIHCGAEFPSGAKFCPDCGKPLRRGGKWKFYNRAFCAEFACKKCMFRMLILNCDCNT